MAQWNSYGAYWQNGTYPAYYGYMNQLQSYDYNQQLTQSSVTEKPKTPPPPGVEQCDPKTNAPPITTSAWSNASLQPQMANTTYAYSGPFPFTHPPSQLPMFPASASLPTHESSQFQPQNTQSSLPAVWNNVSVAYHYDTNVRPVHPTGLASPLRLSLPSTYLPMGSRFPFLNADVPKIPPSTEISKEILQQPPQSLQAKSAKEQWSDELKDYVQRAFCSIDTSEEKDQMERILKEKLEYIFRNNIKVDWKTENIPTIPSRAIASFKSAMANRAISSVNALSQQSVRGGRKTRRRRRGANSSNDTNPDANGTFIPRGNNRETWRGKLGGLMTHVPIVNESRLTQRATRFKDHLSSTPAASRGSIARTTSQLILTYVDERDDLAVDFGSCQIVGTMQEIEKQYLRLTRAPDPSEVRPLCILKQSLENVKQKWFLKKDYHWVCEQFKSIRQDLTVQCIDDEFTVSVYESHADVALEAGDFEEFHQCQSQLLRLHKEGLGVGRLLEFTAYRILYYIFTLDLLGINTIMAGLRPAHKTNPCIEFALKVRSAWSLNNYHRFFRLVYPPKEDQQPPMRCKQVINWFVDRERRESIKIMLKVFRPTLSLSYVANVVGYASSDLCKEFVCKEFSITENALEPNEKIDCKAVWSELCSGNC